MTGQPAIVRPNGKPYRPRKRPTMQLLEDRQDERTFVAVLRTHDYQHAIELAGNLIAEYDLNPTIAYTDWLRLAPWNDGTWISDTARGVPCVVIPYE